MSSMILPFACIKPKIKGDTFIADNAVIVGDVAIGSRSSVWFNVVIRGDVASIRIGENTNIQDGTTVHVTRANHLANKTGASGGPAVIGSGVTIGHNAIIHACTIGDNCFVGMGSILLDLSVMQPGSMLAAGSLLTCGKVVESGQLWSGRPAKLMRILRPEEMEYISISADNYWKLALQYCK